ncbi:hypothetical protein GE061_008641 [Apolygus lucorum]|uniref:BED-type domain-containing protein n=1 Tax=Apolygus lucorum TaxID=248454 RepID=A0A8S9WQI3_APOLU|nr:hypothetical protein GE061_008641 [Apolygus lucorum]
MSETKTPMKRKRSLMWQYFDAIDAFYAICKICGGKVAFRSTTSNLKRHMTAKHPNVIMDEKTRRKWRAMKDEGKDRRSSKVWQLFTRIGSEGLAKCELCGHMLSYKSSTTNLAKHIERKHTGAFQAIGSTDEDPRESLKEFITLENPDGVDDEGEGEDGLRDGDSEWTPPKKLIRKSAPPPKKVKPELISSNGVDYLIYTHDQPPQRTPQPQVVTKVAALPQRPPQATTSRTAPPPEEDEFSCFARFLSKRIRALKDPYWQSCAINEINSALHKVEMRRYEPPRVPLGSDFSVQTDPLADHVSHVISHVDPHHVEQRIVEEIVEDVVVGFYKIFTEKLSSDMLFRALLVVLAASESLSVPSKSFLHHVDFPGKIEVDGNKTEHVSNGDVAIDATSSAAISAAGSPALTITTAKSSPKQDVDTIIPSSRQIRSIESAPEPLNSSQASSVGDGVISTEPAEVDAPSKSTNSDGLSKERLIRSILEQADMSVDADKQSTNPAKCQCPSAECSGKVSFTAKTLAKCRLMDSTKDTAPTSAKSVSKEGSVDTIEPSSRQIRSIADSASEPPSSSQASSVGDGVISTAPAEVDAPSKSTNSDSLTKERLARSLLEQAGLSVDADQQPTVAAKCQVPFGRMLWRNVLSKERLIRSILEQVNSSVDADKLLTSPTKDADVVNSTVVPTVAPKVDLKPSLPEANVGTSNDESTDKSPASNETESAKASSVVSSDAAASGNSSSNNTTSNNDSNGFQGDPASTETEPPVETEESHIMIIKPRPVRSVQDFAPNQPTIEPNSSKPSDVPSVLKSSSLGNSSEVNQTRPKRSPQMYEHATEEVVVEESTTIKMANDTPEGFMADQTLLERSRRLYVRSVDSKLEESDSTENKTKPVSESVVPTEKQEQGVKRIRRHEVGNNNEGSAIHQQPLSAPDKASKTTNGQADTAQAPASADTPHSPDKSPSNGSINELPEVTLPADESYSTDRELTGTKYVRSKRDSAEPLESNKAANLSTGEKPVKEAADSTGVSKQAQPSLSSKPSMEHTASKRSANTENATSSSGGNATNSSVAPNSGEKPQKESADSNGVSKQAQPSQSSKASMENPASKRSVNTGNATSSSGGNATNSSIASNSGEKPVKEAADSTGVSKQAQPSQSSKASMENPASKRSVNTGNATSSSGGNTTNSSIASNSGERPLKEAGVSKLALPSQSSKASMENPASKRSVNTGNATSSSGGNATNSSVASNSGEKPLKEAGVSKLALPSQSSKASMENPASKRSVNTGNATSSSGGNATNSSVASNSGKLPANTSQMAVNSSNTTKMADSKGATDPTSTGKAGKVHHGPEITHRKFIHLDSETTSSRNEGKIKRKEQASKEQENRRLGDYEDRSSRDEPGIGGPLDIRTMGGNQLNIDPVDVDYDSHKVKPMEQRSPIVKSGSPLHPPAALTSLFLAALLLLTFTS